jgi:hypothetical protein
VHHQLGVQRRISKVFKAPSTGCLQHYLLGVQRHISEVFKASSATCLENIKQCSERLPEGAHSGMNNVLIAPSKGCS